MKILEVLPYGQRGGTEKAFSILSQGLIERDHKVTVLIPDGPGITFFKETKLELLPPGCLQRRKMIVNLLKEYDLVHIHAARELVKDYNKPVVFTPHSYYNQLDRLMVRVFARKAQIICFTEWEKMMLTRLGLKKITVIPNGILQPPSLEKTNDRALLRIGYLGRLTKDKGLDMLFKELVKLEEPYELVIAGEGKEEENLKHQARILKLPVTFVGFQEAYAFLSTLDIFVLPSRTETFGIALVEAMSQGLALVAADVCGLKEIVGSAGLVVSHHSLASALKKVIRDKDLRESLGNRAKERFAKCYTSEKMVTETEKLYLSLLQG